VRARWLKPEFFTDKKIAELGPIAALVYEALWVIADDGGTAKGDAETLKSQVFYRWSAVLVPDISTAFWHLSQSGRIRRYRVGDDEYSQIVNWKRHQQVHKPGKFRHPSIEKGVRIDVSESIDASIDERVTRNSAGKVPGVSTESAAPGTHTGTSAAPLPASPPPRLLDTQIPKQPPPLPREADESIGEQADLAQLSELSTAASEALNAIASRSSNRFACLTALSSIAAGNDPATPKPTRSGFELALIDYAANGERWNAAYFRTYLKRTAKSDADDWIPPSRGVNGQPANGSPRAPRRDFGGARNDAAIDAWLADKERQRAEAEDVKDVEPEPGEIPHGE